MKSLKRFTAVVLSIKVVILLIVPPAGQLVNAQSAVPCLQSVGMILAPEWVAVRQQYETTYQPIPLTNPQTVIEGVAALPPLALEWAAVRQQYETTYQPIPLTNPQTAIEGVAALPPLAPEWAAVRQQYEANYAPAC